MKPPQKTKNQHYVPRSYLKAWADENGDIWALDFDTGKVFPSSPEGIASKRFFYDTVLDPYIDPKNIQPVEKMLGKIETDYIPSLKKIIEYAKTGTGIPIDFKVQFGYFIWLQWVRTRKFRDGIDPSALQGIPDAEAILQISAFVEPHFIENFVNMVSKRIWVIVKAWDNFQFPTSDNPVLIGTALDGLETSVHLMKIARPDFQFVDDAIGFQCSLVLNPQYMLMLLDPNQNVANLQHKDQIRDLTTEDFSTLVIQLLTQTHKQMYFARNGNELNVFQGLAPLRSVGANLSGIISNTLLQAVKKGVEVPVLKEMKHQLQTIKEKIDGES
jgi:hypothetical protein